MGPIRFSGMNSCLPPDIVDRIMAAERIPLQQMAQKRSQSEARLELVNQLHEKITGIRDNIKELAGTRGFSDLEVTSGDPSVLTGTADPNTAASGSWNIEVMELPQKAAAITNGFPDADKTQVGVGYLKFETADGPEEVYISSENSTLNGVASAVNAAGLGLKASVISDSSDKDNPYKLIFSGNGLGDKNEIEFPTLYLLDGDRDIYFDEKRAATNGKVKLDGFEIDVQDKTLTNLVPGITIDLKQAAPGREINITVNEDHEAITGKVDEFVKSVNGVLSFIQKQNQMNEATDTTRTLGGDSMLRQIESRLRRLLQNPQMGVNGSINRLSQIGIEFNRSGTLNLDSEKFNSALAGKTQEVQEFLSGDGFNTGFIPTLRRELATMLDTAYGPISNRQKSLNQKIRQVNDRVERKERQLEKKEASLVRKFSKLDETMSRLQSQGGAVAGLGAAGAVGGGAPMG